MLRLFIAWTIPEPLRREVEKAMGPLRTTLPRCSWVRPESFHLTFAFLGDQPATVVPKIQDTLSPKLAEHPPFQVTLTGAGFFPSTVRPRVGWIAMEPGDRLIAIADETRKSLLRIGVQLDDRPFKPHLTLVRTKDRWSKLHADAFLTRLGGFRSTPVLVDHLSIYSSRLDPAGAIHSELVRLKLGG
ncbi:MAG TPA: RNA 2',3'-cyclic phosphodiesterase [Thermoanaerobaculia bacterium]|nr:RNA 2',3'-cyclic phosphodiesterase [Thermoanaerobaculia bacterium]